MRVTWGLVALLAADFLTVFRGEATVPLSPGDMFQPRNAENYWEERGADRMEAHCFLVPFRYSV